MITIDGSRGEGGGQVLRTSLSLAMCLGEDIRLINIRAKRNKPGLLRQHYTCAQAAAYVSLGQTRGLEMGSSELEFSPGKQLASQDYYHFAIGTAGSTCLVFQTLLPALLLTKKPTRVSFSGGTHNTHAPSWDFINYSFLKTLGSMGIEAESQIERHGFYPIGGGNWHVDVTPWQAPKALELKQRGNEQKRRAIAISSRLPHHVVERELKAVHKALKWKTTELLTRQTESPGPGNALSLQVEYENSHYVVDTLGERNKRAESVARDAIESMKAWQQHEAPVCEHLADQLLLPMVLGHGGHFITCHPSEHTLTNIDLISEITGCPIHLEQVDEQHWLIDITNGLALTG